jgi:hypothetical protein
MVAILTLTGQILQADASDVKPVESDRVGIKAGQLMLFPSTHRVEAYIQSIPEGESRDIATMRRELAASKGAHATSLPALRGRLLEIAEATFDAFDDGALLRELTPVWRVLDEQSGSILDRLSFDPTFLFDMRASERARPSELERQAA